MIKPLHANHARTSYGMLHPRGVASQDSPVPTTETQ